MGPRRDDPNKTGSCPYCTLKMYCKQHRNQLQPQGVNPEWRQPKDSAGTMSRMYDQIITSKLTRFRERFNAALEKHSEAMWGPDPLLQLKSMETSPPEVKKPKKAKKESKKKKDSKKKKKKHKKKAKKNKKHKSRSSSSDSSDDDSDSSSSSSSSSSESDEDRDRCVRSGRERTLAEFHFFV
ncbi:conserved hypothetical protein [Neospora caninum Liverpool]|uniref:Uncharacterized protein n=1 Tax=Neospora caninum (strain Liverpool) TaxID=572307 RepID=F0VMX8_NEOCL|nr:conserved hypothetical protein [Neospora caninum Liverpool]CBZ55074.1 conserved hypothetical protein [Neospora caninum Liverpool]|eukprot:XP_003885102.1 conserved hypothetical protein [Neospora caninum Liverpool]